MIPSFPVCNSVVMLCCLELKLTNKTTAISDKESKLFPTVVLSKFKAYYYQNPIALFHVILPRNLVYFLTLKQHRP